MFEFTGPSLIFFFHEFAHVRSCVLSIFCALISSAAIEFTSDPTVFVGFSICVVITVTVPVLVHTYKLLYFLF